MTLMRDKGFYIIRCPKCGRYTYAPIQQKTRLCVYCQRIIKVNPIQAQYVKNAETARTRVKLYQTGKHHEEFMRAVEESREEIKALIPKEEISLEKLGEKVQPISSASGRRNILESLLSKLARTTPVDLHVLEKESEKAGLQWEWVAKQLEGLIRSGYLICPRPWQIKLVAAELGSPTQLKSLSITSLARRIGEIIRESERPLDNKEILKRLDKNEISEGHFEKALEMLKTQGYVFKTRQNTYRWTG
jgi:hypothetical protein